MRRDPFNATVISSQRLRSFAVVTNDEELAVVNDDEVA